jgi:hypothetical protein
MERRCLWRRQRYPADPECTVFPRARFSEPYELNECGVLWKQQGNQRLARSNSYARLVGILLSEQMQIKIALEIFCKFVGESRDTPCNDISGRT